MKKITLSFLLILNGLLLIAQTDETFTILSPDKSLIIQVDVNEKIYYSLQVREQEIIKPSPISITLEDGEVLGENPKIRKVINDYVNEDIYPIFGNKSEIDEKYNFVEVIFKGGYSLEVRAYNDGFGYRFKSALKKDFKVVTEEVTYNFEEDYPIYISQPRTNNFQHSYEDFYNYLKLSEVSKDSMGMLPILVEAKKNVKIGLTEADLFDYPGMHLAINEKGKNSLKGVFPGYPTKTKIGGHNDFNLVVTERADYIAESPGTRNFPWRVFIVSEIDTELLDNDLVYKLSKPAEGDFSWVKPGKVAWDWWNAMNLKGVNFKSGINTETYKYFIDFAAEHGIEYVNLDEGWSDQFDLLKLDDQIDMIEILDYAKKKNVDIIVWCVARTLDAQLEEALDQFVEWGVKGIKVDFMDRDDQVMVDFYNRVAEEAAKRKLLVNFHGAYKPTGLNKTFPNVINQEAVRGLEYNKFAKPMGTTADHAVTIPFIRMLAGSMDYTPGAMVNAQSEDFVVRFDRPMSQGTRCQQLAMFIIYYSPLQMLADAPTAYEGEPEILDFLSKVPTTWDNTWVISGKVGEYAVIAKQKGEDWFVGGMTNTEARTLAVNFSFLGDGEFLAEIFKDGLNADRLGEDYIKETKTIKASNRMEFDLAPGGGFSIRITPKK
ncbi:glycoside hydrolase family 97 protein [Flexithrix dorotheae]|uniref:glycoside hydrolase family 97 protein n=1 Tax=Flexithrix dorotheae TaxID=70993 RepID=UPI0003711332|nr:glycoside hydrolase family 97 protein [Flexithrix dorotheae]